MNEDFEKILQFTWDWEGRGQVHTVSGDPGGTTKWGIAQRYHPDVDVASLTEDKAREIYYREYWLKYKCDQDKHPENMVIFEIAVNPGAYLLYRVPPGFDWKDLIIARLDRYMDLVAESPVKVKFLQGWNNRTMDLYQKILRGEL